ncbi:MAG: glycoside hydrolase family 2 protein [Paracoccaceae bacterium]
MKKLLNQKQVGIIKKFVLCSKAIMANAHVYLNDKKIVSHTDGYTPFIARLTDELEKGENILRVKIDGSENPSIPPFGGRIDYLTYAGIYRDVHLRVTSPIFIHNIKIETPNVLEEKKSLKVRVELLNPKALDLSGFLTANLLNSEGKILSITKYEINENNIFFEINNLKNIKLWDIDNPLLYELDISVETPHGIDNINERFGFRSAEFNKNGFMLNGNSLKIRGLNRHQSYPYVGYALGKSAQHKDAEILKFDLRVNLVRTSHYPQSKHFLNRCDEIGLLVFEEIPGWQHLGDNNWQNKSIENVQNMIERDWNHPSIILWGVRINESPDNHDFYLKTNQVAHQLDSTRQTGGVRKFVEGEFLEDVYTMNDFILGEEELGGNRGRIPLRPQRECTGFNYDVPYMVTEFNGHMFPTKSYDNELRQNEHVLRHLEVLNAAYGDSNNAGAIGWCAFDYNTHKDFGSGDRICYHGVMDMFREPKFASYVYSSQDDAKNGIVLEPVTVWARGERNIQGVLPLIILTNCDHIEFLFNKNKEKFSLEPDFKNFPNLPHPPIIVNAEHFPENVFGTWGTDWQNVKIDGYTDGKLVKSKKFVADPVPTNLEIVPDLEEVSLGTDVRVIIRALDQVGNKIRYLYDTLSINVTGPVILFGPNSIPLAAGSAGFWIRSIGSGIIKISIKNVRFPQKEISIVAK